MAHEGEIKLELFTPDEHHKVRNFLEALWVKLGEAGWASWDDFDALFNYRVNPGARFTFQVSTRRKLGDALQLVARTISAHMMGLLTSVTHRNVG